MVRVTKHSLLAVAVFISFKCANTKSADSSIVNIMISPYKFDFNVLKKRPLTKEELQRMSAEYQGGVELVDRYYHPGQELPHEELIKGIAIVLDTLKKGAVFPMANYANYRSVTNVLGLAFGEILRREHKWEWYFINEQDKGYIGYTIVSPDKKLGILAGDLFYQKILYDKEIMFSALYESIRTNQYTRGNNGYFQFYEPWRIR